MISLDEAKAISDLPEVQRQLDDFDANAQDAAYVRARLVCEIVNAYKRSLREFPQERSVGRMGDMAPPGRSHMTVGFDADSDVCVSIWDQEHAQHGALAGIEFCTSFGGGRSPRTRDALVALMVAMEADNAACPQKQWPPVEGRNL